MDLITLIVTWISIWNSIYWIPPDHVKQNTCEIDYRETMREIYNNPVFTAAEREAFARAAQLRYESCCRDLASQQQQISIDAQRKWLRFLKFHNLPRNFPAFAVPVDWRDPPDDWDPDYPPDDMLY